MSMTWVFDESSLERALGAWLLRTADDRAPTDEEVIRDFLKSPEMAKARIEHTKLGTTVINPAAAWPFPPHKPKPERE